MKDAIIQSQEHAQAVLVGLITPDIGELKSQEHLNELEFLALTAGFTTIKRFTQSLPQPNATTFLGSGKLQELAEYVASHEVGIIIFDDELSAKQLRNIEGVVKRRILDRTGLILEIFATRAQTLHAKTQVEMAQYQYLLPRLTRMWTHLERQRGGAMMRGPGETQLETDRRLIQDKISLLKKKLDKIDKQKFQQRKNRGKLVRVALVGYTNVGKSTIMNQIAKSDVLAENKLFATLDTTVRKVVIHNLPFLLTDTVGFIRKLPSQLVESFKSTLDEVREADLVVHVVDVSHPEFEEQIDVVQQTLTEIGVATDTPTLLVFNKIDQYEQNWITWQEESEQHINAAAKDPYANERDPLGLDLSFRKIPTPEDLQKSWMAKMGQDTLFISATTKMGMDTFLARLYQKVREIHIKRYPYNDFLYPDYEELFSQE